MRLDRLHRQYELAGDLLVRVAAGDQRSTSRSRGVSRSSSASTGARRRPAKASRTKPARRGEKTASPAATRRIGVEQLVAGDRLGDVTASAGADDGDHVLGRVGHRQGQEPRVGRSAAAAPRGSPAPPPPGRWTSSSTTSGRGRADAGDAASSVGRFTDDVDCAGRARPAPRRGTARDRRRGRSGDDVAVGDVTSGSGTGSSHSVPPPRWSRPRRSPPTRATCPTIESHKPRRSDGTVATLEADAIVADEGDDRVRFDLDVDRRRARRRRAWRRWSRPRAPRRRARRRLSSSGASPTTTSSTGSSWSSSTWAAISSQRARSVPGAGAARALRVRRARRRSSRS